MKREGLKFKGKGVRVRITKISVKGLFGMFDHEIPLNQESRITIVHGPNGVGKTVLMELINGLFNFDYNYVGRVPFDSFELEFDDRRGISVANVDSHSRLLIGNFRQINFGSDGNDLLVTAWEDDTVFDLRTRIMDEELYDLAKKVLGTEYMHVEAGSDSYWLDVISDELFEEDLSSEDDHRIRDKLLSISDLLEKYPEVHKEVYGEMPEWFASIRQDVKTWLIDTHRLGSDAVDVAALKYYFNNDNDDNYYLPTFGSATAELASRIAAKLDKIDIDFERDVFSQVDVSPELSEMMLEALMQALNERNPESSRLQKIKTEYPDSWQAFVNVFRDVHREKRLLNERQLYEEIINERLLFKSLEIDEDEGLSIVNENGDEVHASYLSSGEQHLLVLYYKLLFETEPDTLVMIDEPELSMNVVWQRNFLKDLQRIIELRKFDVLIATHSPQIIHDKWDWVVHLGEKVDD